ncbi:MAG: membrane protein insertion efficiency factor YidD [Candidatus Neomarinimicrobiota bacterium]
MFNRAAVTSLSYIIKGYQVVVSPLLGNNCRFHPTCSSYAIDALEKKGLAKGLFLTLKRIARCNPLCKGGHDPVI